jgi:hypothetical protein
LRYFFIKFDEFIVEVDECLFARFVLFLKFFDVGLSLE